MFIIAGTSAHTLWKIMIIAATKQVGYKPMSDNGLQAIEIKAYRRKQAC